MCQKVKPWDIKDFKRNKLQIHKTIDEFWKHNIN